MIVSHPYSIHEISIANETEGMNVGFVHHETQQKKNLILLKADKWNNIY